MEHALEFDHLKPDQRRWRQSMNKQEHNKIKKL